MVAIDFHSMDKKTGEVNGYRQLLLIQNIFFCVQQKKQTHTGLEQFERG